MCWCEQISPLAHSSQATWQPFNLSHCIEMHNTHLLGRAGQLSHAYFTHLANIQITGEPLNSRSRILAPNKREITGVDCIVHGFVLVISAIHTSNGLVQERCNSSALALELHLSCINPSTCSGFTWFIYTYYSGLFHRHWGSHKISSNICEVTLKGLGEIDRYQTTTICNKSRTNHVHI